MGAGAVRCPGQRAAEGCARGAGAEAGVAGSHCGSQGNPDAEERKRDVRQRRSHPGQNNLNYQKDLNEVAVIVAKNLAGRVTEVADAMAQIYANEFTEQELKDLVTFYKSPLGNKLLVSEPRAIQFSMSYMNQWAQQFAATVDLEFRSEMKKRGKPI